MFLRWAGLQPASESEHAFSADELEYVLSHSRHIHPGDALVNKIMVRSLRLRDVTAQQVMLPRTKVVALWADKSIEENLKIAQKSGHSRFPVCQESLDNVLGMVLIKEWLWQIQALGEKSSFQPLIRPVLTFFQQTPLPTMMELFRSSRRHLAVIIDANEAMLGIVTFEDVLEEIVGEIRDELDIERGPIFEQTENSIVVDASLPLRELRAETGWNFEYQPRENVGAWVTRRGRTPLQREESMRLGRIRNYRAADPCFGPAKSAHHPLVRGRTQGAPGRRKSRLSGRKAAPRPGSARPEPAQRSCVTGTVLAPCGEL